MSICHLESGINHFLETGALGQPVNDFDVFVTVTLFIDSIVFIDKFFIGHNFRFPRQKLFEQGMAHHINQRQPIFFIILEAALQELAPLGININHAGGHSFYFFQILSNIMTPAPRQLPTAQ